MHENIRPFITESQTSLKKTQINQKPISRIVIFAMPAIHISRIFRPAPGKAELVSLHYNTAPRTKEANILKAEDTDHSIRQACGKKRG